MEKYPLFYKCLNKFESYSMHGKGVVLLDKDNPAIEYKISDLKKIESKLKGKSILNRVKFIKSNFKYG